MPFFYENSFTLIITTLLAVFILLIISNTLISRKKFIDGNIKKSTDNILTRCRHLTFITNLNSTIPVTHSLRILSYELIILKLSSGLKTAPKNQEMLALYKATKKRLSSTEMVQYRDSDIYLVENHTIPSKSKAKHGIILAIKTIKSTLLAELKRHPSHADAIQNELCILQLLQLRVMANTYIERTESSIFNNQLTTARDCLFEARKLLSSSVLSRYPQYTERLTHTINKLSADINNRSSLDNELKTTNHTPPSDGLDKFMLNGEKSKWG